MDFISLSVGVNNRRPLMDRAMHGPVGQRAGNMLSE